MIPSNKDKPINHELQAFTPLEATRALYFSVVVETNSITLASKILGVSASTVSRKLDDLEASMGVRLIDRDTRHFRLTEAGESYLHFVLKANTALKVGRQMLDRYSSDLKGRLRVLCSPAIGRYFVADLAIAFGRLHPFLHVSLELDSKIFSLTESEFDVGLCVGMPTQERAVVSKLGELTRGYVATSYFLETYGIPNDAHALADLPLCNVTDDHSLHDQVALSGPAKGIIYAPVKLVTNDPEVGLCAVLSGDLIGRMELFYCADELLSGRLHSVLPELNDARALYAVVSSRKGKPRKVQMFVDFLQAHLAPRLRTLEQQVKPLAGAVS